MYRSTKNKKNKNEITSPDNRENKEKKITSKISISFQRQVKEDIKSIRQK